MFTLSVKSNVESAAARFSLQRREIALATAKALTFTAERVRDAEKREIQRVFDRPTPYTLNSLFMRGATPQRLEAKVWFKDLHDGDPWHYLVPQVYGGERHLKQFEKHLQSAGWLPRGMYVVPGSRATLDAYGNISRGQLIQVLSALRALPAVGYMANRTARSAARKAKSKRGLVDYFVGRPKPGAPDGIWQRVGPKGLRPIFMFVRSPRYRIRFRFYDIANDVANREFPALLNRAFEREATRTPLPAAA